MERHENPVFEGVVEDGVIRSRDVERLPDGTRVEVRVVARRTNKKRTNKRSTTNKRKQLASPELMKFAGSVRGLPRDASINIDHYLYGAPKRRVTRSAKRKR